MVDALKSGAILEVLAKTALDRLPEVGEMLARIHDIGVADVVRALGGLPWPELGYGQRNHVAEAFRGFMPATSLPAEEFVALANAMRSNLGSIHEHTLQRGFVEWGSSHPLEAGAVAKHLAAGSDDSSYFGLAVEAWRKVAPEEALSTALLATKDHRAEVQRQAIYSLAGFGAWGEDVNRAATGGLAAIIKTGDLNARRAATGSAISMLAAAPQEQGELVSALQAAAVDPPAEIRIELISGYARAKTAYPPQLRATVFELMKTVTGDDLEAVNLVDMALFGMDPVNERESFEDLLGSVVRRDEGPSLKSLDSAVYKLQNSGPRTVGWFTIKWLLEGDPALCSEIHHLFPPLDERVHDFDIDEFSLRDDDIFYLARKIFGYLNFMHGPAVSLLCCCLSKLEPANRYALADQISAFWLRNYPGDLERFDAVREAYPRDGLEASVEHMRSTVNAYEGAFRKMAPNRALMPSSSERRVQAERKRDRDSEIRRAAKENSIFGSMVHTSTILYGHSSVTYMYPGDGQDPVRQVMPLGRYEVSVPNPQMDVLCPTRLNFLLFRFRQERRPP